MPIESRELYSSSNGDRWHLVHEPRSGRVFIKHEPNAASGGDISLIEVGEFLVQNHLLVRALMISVAKAADLPTKAPPAPVPVAYVRIFTGFGPKFLQRY